ncbi:Blackbeard [Chaetoceros tenuissimus]|uniref:Blackbeard n=1 Tax=Chaetoceros tenuissimus TaxID=426638 RepID=A0AAD3CNJ0_9STRA|nr:Blackbeard [Chaetoceros tenuissimus]
MIYATALNSPQFNNDSKEVHNLIKELVQNTDGDSWLLPRCSCGRTAMQSLRNHYDGPDQAESRIDVARASIEKLFYRNENMFSLESYSTQMKKNYDVLEKYNQLEYEANKIDTFLKGIRNENNKVVNVVSIAKTMANLNTFQLVQEFISNQLKTIFPPHEIQQGGKKGGRRGVAASKKQKKKATKQRAARIAKISISGRKENGVQLQGYAHYYSNKDFHALTQDTRNTILKACRDNNWVPGNRNRNVDAIATGSKNDDDMSSVGHSLAGHTITMDASVLRGVMAASASAIDEQQQATPPSNGSHARSTASTGTKKYKVTYDANRNMSHVTESRLSQAIQVAKRISLGWTERSATGHFKPSLDAYDYGFRDKAVEWCSVAPVLAEYDETKNIDIVTSATAVDLEDGSTVICVFGQGLWFGEQMKKSPINPNQCRNYGVSLCHDPTDPHRPLAIRKERFSIPMQMFNSSCGFESRHPTMEELEFERPNGVQVPVFHDDTFISDVICILKQQDTYDMYIGAEVLFPNAVGDEQMGKVVKRLRKNDGDPLNTGSYNPLHDTALYQVEFPSGLTENIQANIIAENMFAQVDSKGHHQQILKEISDHSWDHTAIPRWDGYIKSKSEMVLKKTTKGWELLVEWKDGTMTWVPLKDLKNSNPIELAQYAVMNALEEEPAFKWWVPYTLKKRDSIVAKVKSKYWRTIHKFGIRIPKSADEAYKLDADSKTTFWTDAINKEMENVRVAFEFLAGVTPEDIRTGKERPGYKGIPCHMIFDIKMNGKFTRKARRVAGGHVTDPPSAITYSSGVSPTPVLYLATVLGLL